MILTGKQFEVLGGCCFSASFFTTNPIWTGFKLNLHLCSQTLLTNPVRHGMTAKPV